MIKQKADIRKWFPSEDGNEEQRTAFLNLIEQILSGVDRLKDPSRVNLKKGTFMESLFRQARYQIRALLWRRSTISYYR